MRYFLIVLLVLPLSLRGDEPELPRLSEVVSHLVSELAADEDVNTDILLQLPIEYQVPALRMNLFTKETDERYRRFYQEASAREVAEYYTRERIAMDQVCGYYGVDPLLVASLWFVESDLGRNRGDFPVASLFVTLTLLTDSTVLEWNLERALQQNENGESRKVLEQRLLKSSRRKRNWALRELGYLLRLYDQQQLTALQGSWAGALGISQFLPSSVYHYGVDQDGDGVIDLNQQLDALASTANYLRENGWRGSLNEKKMRKVIWRYNHSQPYVEAVYTLYTRSRQIIVQEQP